MFNGMQENYYFTYTESLQQQISYDTLVVNRPLCLGSKLGPEAGYSD
jgi:hypothetical protein